MFAQKKERLSNFELLRIFCMFGVLTTHTFQYLYDLNTTNFSIGNELRVFAMNAGCLAVNCFILISGYFQIKQSWKGFVSLLAPCFFWTLLCTCFDYSTGGIGLFGALNTIAFPLTNGTLWFMTAYFGLYLISPLLNSGINNMDEHKLRVTTILLVIIDVYIGYVHQSKEVTIDGYHLIHFIVLYVVASYFRRHTIDISARRLMTLIFTLLIAGVGLHMAKMVFFPTSLIYSMRYNSPFIMVTSMLTFILFTKLCFKSKIINMISISVLSVYIISSQPCIADRFYGLLTDIKNTYSGIMAFIFILSCMLFFYIICVVLESFRRITFGNIEIYIANIIEKFICNKIKMGILPK